MLYHILILKSGKSDKTLSDFTHAKLINLAESLKLLEKKQIDTLRLINRMRNNLAHDIFFQISVEDFRKITESAQSAFIDFTDGFEQILVEFEDKELFEEVDPMVYSELFMQIAYNLESRYEELGGNFNYFD